MNTKVNWREWVCMAPLLGWMAYRVISGRDPEYGPCLFWTAVSLTLLAFVLVNVTALVERPAIADSDDRGGFGDNASLPPVRPAPFRRSTRRAPARPRNVRRMAKVRSF